MATFGLVHGSWHGAWCWERLVPELEARAHRAVAVDLPAEDPAAGLTRHAELDGGHSPFLSRPAELASVLAQLG